MKTFTSKDLAQSHIKTLKEQGLSIGFVPTMGALHKGHISLVETSKQNNDITIVSIFVNPTQFNNAKDLEKYPKTIEADLEKLERVNCDFVFIPDASELYAPNEAAEIFNFEGLDTVMEGAFRDNHFNGVGTIIKKFFDIVTPTNAYFGKKDFQQLQIIHKLLTITQQPVHIVGCEIYREHDGLAMSSRNVRLSEQHRKAAPFIYATLLEVKKMSLQSSLIDIKSFVEKAFQEHPDLELEYFSIANEKDLLEATAITKATKTRAFIAVFAGEIRLIDNIALY